MILSIIHTVVDIFFVWFLIKHIKEIDELKKSVYYFESSHEMFFVCGDCGCVKNKVHSSVSDNSICSLCLTIRKINK